MNKSTETALNLMRMALALLDQDGSTLAAAHLEQAIGAIEPRADAEGTVRQFSCSFTGSKVERAIDAPLRQCVG